MSKAASFRDIFPTTLPFAFHLAIAMRRILRARLGVARVTVEQTPSALRDSVSRAQALAVKELVSRDPTHSSISAEDQAKLLDLAAAVPWADADRESVMALLVPNGKAQSQRKRRPLQHFAPLIVNYFTQKEWDSLTSAIPFGDKADLLMRRVIELSGRNLAEPTLKLLSSLAMLLADDNAIQLPTSTKKTYMDALKKAFKAKTRQMIESPHYLTVLPPFPGEILKAQPDLYAAAFPGGETPVPCPLALCKLYAVDNSYGCRNGCSADFAISAGPALQSSAPALGSVQMLLQQLMAM